jgi:hypothetical protein
MGQERKKVACPCSMMKYQTTIFSVDKGDQMRVQGGGFASKAHFKKWYKKQLLAILDCMLLNGLVAWNLACNERGARSSIKISLKRYQFMQSVAQSMLDYKDESEAGSASTVPPSLAKALTRKYDLMDHLPMQCKKCRECTVCKLEVVTKQRSWYAGVKIGVSECSSCKCIAHAAIQQGSRRLIHQVPQFANMPCFNILHTDVGLEKRRPGSTTCMANNISDSDDNESSS